MFKEIKAELALDDVEEGNLVQTGAEENSESTGRDCCLLELEKKQLFCEVVR